MDDPPEVHAEQEGPVRLGEVPDRAATGDAGVVADDIDPSEPGDRRLGHCLDLDAAAHIATMDQRLGLVAHELDGLGHARLIDIGEGHPDVVGGEAPGECASDAGTRPRHHRHLVCFDLHALPLLGGGR